MDRISIHPSSLQGEIEIPPSKSQTLRALVFASLAQGTSHIYRYLRSPDTQAMIEACRLLGAKVVQYETNLEVTGGTLKPAEDVINAGNSGLVLRFGGALGALTSGYTVITGDFSIRHRRPVQPLIEGLSQLGAFAASSRGDGHAPLIVKGPLLGGKAEVDGADSQPISALLTAAAFSPYGAELYVRNPGEKPWVALTLHWFDKLGIVYTHHHFEHYTLKGNSCIQPFTYTVPADFSSAAYPLAAALITDSTLTLRGLDFTDPQGDKELFFFLKEQGAQVSIELDTVTVHPGSRLRGGVWDVSRFIDALPLLAVLGCFADGKTEIVGAKGARFKESDRVAAIVQELKKMGACIEEREGSILVERSSLKGAQVESHHDHRIALSLAVAALGAAAGVTSIQGVKCVEKSFPSFFSQPTIFSLQPGKKNKNDIW